MTRNDDLLKMCNATIGNECDNKYFKNVLKGPVNFE